MRMIESGLMSLDDYAHLWDGTDPGWKLQYYDCAEWSRAACPPETVEGPEGPMTLAAQMERNGDWDTAIERYGQVASEWPEHATYANNCIDAIRRKQAASE